MSQAASITALPTAPSRAAPSTFATLADAFIAAMPTMVTQINALITVLNTGTLRRRSITTTDTIVATDYANILEVTGTWTLSATAVATLGDGFYCWVLNKGTGNVTFDPNGAETVDGQTTGIAYPGTLTLLRIESAAWTAVKAAGQVRFGLTSGASWSNTVLGSRQAKARIKGAGASGGKMSGMGAPGGAGAYAEITFRTQLGDSHATSFGTPGAAVTANSTGGNAGTATTFNTNAVTVTCNGGNASSANGGYSLVRGGTASNGDVNREGDPGQAVGGNLSIGGGSEFGRAGFYSATNSLVAVDGYGAGGGGGVDSVSNSGAGGPPYIEVTVL